MRNVILAVVAIAALTAAGIGGVFADFSDIETSEDNYFQTGALDLKVSDFMGNEYQDPDVPVLCAFADAIPCCDKSFFFDLENWGQGTQGTPHVYLHIKNLDCYWVVPKNVWKWVGEDGTVVAPPSPLPVAGDIGTGFPKPLNEPEYVAELGGIAGEDKDGNPVVVPGIGVCYGEGCQLARHVGILIQVAGPWTHETKPATSADVDDADWTELDLSAYDLDPVDGKIKVNELVSQQIDLGNLPYCKGVWVHVALHFQDFDEEDAFAQGLISETYFDETDPDEKKWDHWPTNAMQKDGMEFDMAFHLLQY